MKNLEREYNQRFNQEKKEYDQSEVDAMWSEIDAELQPSSKRPWIYGILLLIGFLAMIGFFMNRSTDSSVVNRTSQNEVVSDENSQETAAPVSIEASETTVANNSNPENNSTSSVENKNRFSTKGADYSTFKSTRERQSVIGLKADGSKDIKNNVAITFESTNNQVKEKNELLSGESNSMSGREINIQNTSTRSESFVIDNTVLSKNKGLSPIVKKPKDEQFENIESMDLLPSLQTSLSYQNVVDLDLPEVLISDNQVSNSIKLHLGINSTLVKSSTSFSNGEEVYQDQLSDSEIGLWSYRNELELGYIFKNVRLGSGLGISHTRIRFDFENTTETKVLKNLLVKIILDGNSQDTISKEYRDTLVNRRISREVVHHNTLRQISIPLRIGYQIEKGAFVLGMDGGVSLNWVLGQSGKSLSALDEIASFDNDSDFQPYQRFVMSYHVRPFIQYNITRKINVHLFSDLSLQKHNNTTLTRSLNQYGFGLGLHYKI